MTRLTACAALLLAATGLPAGVALAQTTDQGMNQGMSPRDVQRGVTVETRPRPDYDPTGVRLGGFRLDAMAEAGPGYDSNIFGQTTNRTSSGFMDQAARVNLASDWTRHAVGISGGMDARQYFSRSDLNVLDWDLGGFGRYDVNADTSVQAGYRHYQSHLNVYNYDVQQAGINQPVPYTSEEGTAGASTRLNRVGLQGNVLYRTYRFDPIVPNGGQLPVSVNDFNTVIGTIGTSYAFAPGRYITGTVILQDINYQQAISQNRNSFTWSVLGGVQYDFDGVWQGKLSLGWQHREYQGNFKSLSGLAALGELIWAPNLLTTVNFNVSRTLQESIRQNAVSYQQLQAGLRVDHELLRNVILSIGPNVLRLTYQDPNQSATDVNLVLTARWLINRNLQLLAGYTFTKRVEATNGFQEFDRNLFTVRLRVAL